MAKYLRNNSQTENLVNGELVPENTDSVPNVTVVNNCKNVLIGVERVFEGDVIIEQKVYSNDCVEKLHGIGVESLRVDGKELVKENMKDGVIINTNIKGTNCKRWSNLLGIVLSGLVIATALSVSFFLCFKSLDLLENPSNKYYPETNLMMNAEKEYPSDAGINFVHRYSWLAQAPGEGIRRQVLPAQRVIISHTATEHCYDVETCNNIVWTIQRYHIGSSGFQDIAYNFLVGGDGVVYIGRGWNHVGAHTRRYNLYNLGISLIGTFTAHLPSEAQLKTTLQLINLGVRLDKLMKNYTLNTHCQFSDTESPGRCLYDIITTWNRFEEPRDALICASNKNKKSHKNCVNLDFSIKQSTNNTASNTDSIKITESFTEVNSEYDSSLRYSKEKIARNLKIAKTVNVTDLRISNTSITNDINEKS